MTTGSEHTGATSERTGPAGRRVVCAALRHCSGDIVCGPRHFDNIMRSQIMWRGQDLRTFRSAERGFIDQHGTFMDRSEAFHVAIAAGQLLHNPPPYATLLMSEDLY